MSHRPSPSRVVILTSWQLLQIEAKRREFEVAYAADPSWSRLALKTGVPKSTVYAFVKKGYVPKNVRTLSLFLSGPNNFELVIQTIWRDRKGRFASPQK